MQGIGPENFTIQNEKNVTKKDILKEADEIHKKCIAYCSGKNPSGKRITIKDTRELDKLFDKMRQDHKEFHGSYPMVLRHMVQELNYNHGVFSKYLDKVESKPWMNDNERLDSYADYATMLFRECNKKHMNLTKINLFREDYRKRLQKEHDDFKNLVTQMQKEVEEKEEKLDKQKREELLETFRSLAPDMSEEYKKIEKLVREEVITTSALEDMIYDIQRVKFGLATYEMIAKEKQDKVEEFKKRLEQVDIAAPQHIDSEEKEKLKKKMILMDE